MAKYNNNQWQYHSDFTFQANLLIDDLFYSASMSGDWRTVASEKLMQGSNLVEAGVASVALLALAGVTGGVGVVVAGAVGAVVTILKVANSENYQIVTRQNENSAKFIDNNETSIADKKLEFKIVLQEVADILILRYWHFIEEVIEPDSISSFAYYGATRIINKIKNDLKNHLKKSLQTDFIINATELADSLLKWSLLSVLSTAEKIIIKPKYSSSQFMATNIFPTKWAYKRSRFVFNSNNNLSEKSILNYFSSPEETTNFSSYTSLKQFGYASFPLSYLLDERKFFDGRELKPVVNKDTVNSLVKSFLCIEYFVTRVEVAEYLQSIVDINNPERQSLNGFLSIKYELNIIAACHDDRLKDLNLSNGNFREVNFRSITLEGSLENTIWEYARLSKAKFKDNKLIHCNFSHAFLEKTEWCNVLLCGNFSYANLSGANIKQSKIVDIIDIGCQWDLVQFDENMYMPLSDKQDSFEKKLTDELNDRLVLMQKRQGQFVIWQKIQEEKWELQDKINSDYARQLFFIENWIGIADKQPVANILNRIKTMSQKLLNKISAQPYLDLYVMGAGVGEVKNILVRERLMDFYHNQQELFFLLHGCIGSGKTGCVCRFVNEVLSMSETESDLYPILIKLKYVQDSSAENFLEACLLTQFARSEILVLKNNFRCLVVLDGLENCGFDINQRFLVEECLSFNQECKKGSWKVLFTASTQLLLESTNYRERLRYSEEVYFPFESEYTICPLNKEDIDEYVSRYYPGVSLADQNLRDLYDIAKTPIMLHIICEVLNSQDINAAQIQSKTYFYQEFLKNWSKHVLQNDNTYNLTETSILLSLEAMAYQMFSENTDKVEWPIKDNRDVLEIIRDNKLGVFNYLLDPVWKMAGSLSPINLKKDEVRQVIICQIRAPFQLYALAIHLIELLQNPLMQRLAAWNFGYLTDPTTIDVFDSLEELVNASMKKEIYIKYLCEMVTASCNESGVLWSCAASNAISLLNYIGFNFSLELDRNIWRNLNAPHAQLRYAKLAGFDLSNGKIPFSKLHGAELVDVKMHGTDIENTMFYDGMSIVHTGKHTETFAVYPSDEPIIAYSVLKKHGSEEREIIIKGANGAKYPSLPGHSSEIKSMAWGVIDDEIPKAFLASASVNGTIRIWQIVDSSYQEVMKLRCEEKSSINSIKWFRDGNLLASGGDDGILRIWDIKKGICVFSCDLSANINDVIFGRDKDLILSVDSSGYFRVWALDLNNLKIAENENQLWGAEAKHPEDDNIIAKSISLAVPETKVAVGYANGNIVIFSIELQSKNKNINPSINLQMLSILHGSPGAVNSIIWNSHCLVSGSEDGMVMVWSPTNGIHTAVYQGDGNPVKKVAWLIGGRQIIADQTMMLSVYDPDYQMSTKLVFRDIPQLVTNIAPFKNIVAIGHIDGSVWLWDVSNLAKITRQKIFSHKTAVVKLLMSKDGSFLVSLDKENNIYILDNRFSEKLPIDIQQINLESDTHQISWYVNDLMGSNELIISSADGCIHFFQLSGKDRGSTWSQYKIFSCEAQLIAAPKAIAVFERNSDNSKSLVLSSGSEIKIFDINNLELPPKLLSKSESKEIVQLAFSQNGLFLLAKYCDKTITVYRTDTWSQIWKDTIVLDKKRVIWVQTEDSEQYLIIGNKYNLELFNASSQKMSITHLRTISSGVENIAYHAGMIYLGDKKSVDMLDFSKLIAGKNEDTSFIIRFGYGTNVRGLDVRTAINIDEQTKRFLEFEGAKVSSATEELSFSEKALSCLGFARVEKVSILPTPNVQKNTICRRAHSFYRSESSSSQLSNSNSPKVLVTPNSFSMQNLVAADMAVSHGEIRQDVEIN